MCSNAQAASYFHFTGDLCLPLLRDGDSKEKGVVSGLLLYHATPSRYKTALPMCPKCPVYVHLLSN